VGRGSFKFLVGLPEFRLAFAFHQPSTTGALAVANANVNPWIPGHVVLQVAQPHT